MLTIRLPEDIEIRLARLAKATGRTKTFYAKEAILRHLEELEDYYQAAEVSIQVKKGKEKVYDSAEVKQSLGLSVKKVPSERMKVALAEANEVENLAVNSFDSIEDIDTN